MFIFFFAGLIILGVGFMLIIESVVGLIFGAEEVSEDSLEYSLLRMDFVAILIGLVVIMIPIVWCLL